MLLRSSCYRPRELYVERKGQYRRISATSCVRNAPYAVPRRNAHPDACRSFNSRKICRSAGASEQATASGAAATPTTLYVTQLDNSVKGDDLTAHFRAQPGFASAFIMEVADEESGQQQHLGYVQFNSAEAAAAAQQALDGSELRQARIKVRGQRGSSAAQQHEQQHAGEPSTTASAQPSEAAPAAEGPSTPTAVDGPAPAQQLSETPSASSHHSSSSSSSSSSSDVGTDSGREASSSSSGGGGGGGGSQAGGEESSSAQTQGVEVKGPEASKARRKQQVPAASPAVLFVPALRRDTTEEQLQQHFGSQPGVESVKTRKYRGRRVDGYVIFSTAEAAAAAKQVLEGTQLNDKPLVIYTHDGTNRDQAKASSPSAGEQGKQQQRRSGASKPGSSSEGSAGNSSSSGGGGQGRMQKPRQGLSYDLKVVNLPWSCTQEGLADHFKDCEGFLQCVTTLNEEGRPSGVGYVRFSSAQAAQAALQAKHETELDGRAIRISIPQPQLARYEAALGGGKVGSDSSTSSTSPAIGANSSTSGSAGKAAWVLQAFNLAWDVTDQDLIDHFGDCEGFESAFIVTSKDNRPSGSGFVMFGSEQALTKALKAKQGTSLVGRSVYLRATGPGSVEHSNEGHVERAGAQVQADTLVLMGLPLSFTYREVLGLCSFFGTVKRVVRRRSDIKASDSGTSASSTADGDGEADGPSQEAGQKISVPEDARKGQPCFVTMGSARAAQAAVQALDGRMLQGYSVEAGFATKESKKQTAKLESNQDALSAAAASS